MSELSAAAAALGAAVCFAVSSVCQHYDASRVEPIDRLRLMRRLLARPVWLLGSVAGIGGVVLQVLALAWGLLIVVQPLLVTGLLFALPASMLVQRRRPALAEWWWAVLLAAGLALFLLAARPHGTAGHPIDPHRILIATACAGTLAVLAVVAGAGPAARYRAALWGAAAGAGFGMAGALGKYCLLLVPQGVGRLLADWPLWTLLVVVVAAVVLVQAAFQAGPLAASLPPLTIIDPVVAVVLGVVGLSESLMASPLAIVGQVLGAVAMAIAVVGLARRTADP